MHALTLDQIRFIRRSVQTVRTIKLTIMVMDTVDNIVIDVWKDRNRRESMRFYKKEENYFDPETLMKFIKWLYTRGLLYSLIFLTISVCFFVFLAHSKLLSNYNVSTRFNSNESSDGTNDFHTFWLFTRNNHRRPQPSKPTRKWLILLIILLAGDIEINPGPIETITANKWGRTVYQIEVEKKQHGNRIVKLNKRASGDGLKIGDIIVSVENLDSQPPKLLDDSIFATNFIGIKRVRFSILRDDPIEPTPSPAPKVQPKQHQWKTPDRPEQTPKSTKESTGTAKQLFSTTDDIADESETAKTKSIFQRIKEKKFRTKRDKQLKRLQDQKKKYQEISPLSKSDLLEIKKHREKERIEELTPTSKQEYLKSKQQQYTKMTPKSQESYKQKARESAKISYSQLTPESKEAKIQSAKLRYSELTPGSKGEYLSKAKEGVQKQRTDATPNTKEAMKQKRREADAQKEAEMDPVAAEKWRKYKAEQKARIRQARSLELISNMQDMAYKERVELIFPDLNKKFNNSIDKGCPYICVVCYTTRYR